MWFKEFEKTIEKYNEAINLLENDNDIDPDEDFIYETYIKIGKCYKELGSKELALENIEKGKNLAIERNQIKWINKAKNYLKLHNNKK